MIELIIEILKGWTIIEWTFTILVYIGTFYLMEKRASNPKIRLRGIIIDFTAGFLQMIFLASVGIWSMAFISFTFLFLKAYGIKNCIKEILREKNDVRT